MPSNEASRKHGNALRSALFSLVLWLFLKPLELFFGWLSPRGITRVAGVFYWLAWPFCFGMRKVSIANLKVAFPEMSDRERRRIANASIRHTICIALEWLHLLRKPEDHERLLFISDETRQLFTEVRASSPNGTVMELTAHLGNWELFSHVKYVSGHQGAVIMSVFSEPALNSLAARLRAADCDTVLIPSRGAVYGILKAIKANRDLGLLIDQNISTSRGGVYMPFFGLDAATTKAPATVALRVKMPIVVFGSIRQPDGTYVAEHFPLDKPSMEYDDDYELSCAILRAYERMIRKYPEQYLWSYRRWRDIPPSADEATAMKFPYYAKRAKH